MTDIPEDEPLRGTHIRIYMEATIPSKSGGKRIVVSHDYSQEETIDQLEQGNETPLVYMGTQQWLKMIEGLARLNR